MERVWRGRILALHAKRMRPSGKCESDKAKNQDQTFHVYGLAVELVKLRARRTRFWQRSNAATG